MEKMFRSEEVVLCQIFIQSDAAYSIVSELGETGCVQFRDINSESNALQRKFVKEVCLCEEMERKIVLIENVIKENDKNPQLHHNLDEFPKAIHLKELLNLNTLLEKYESEITELTANLKNIKSSLKNQIERRRVLEILQDYFITLEVPDLMSSMHEHFDHNFTLSSFIVGVIDPQRVFNFERMLWRLTRGTAYVKTDLQFTVRNQETGQECIRNVFIVFFQGDQIKSRILKVCSGFHATIYECPNRQEVRLKMLRKLRENIQELRIIMSESEMHLQRIMNKVRENLLIWKFALRKSKAIFCTLNKFDFSITRNCLVAECWAPLNDLTMVQKALTDGNTNESGVASFLNVIHTDDIPPTFNRTNKFTRGFQNLIDAYGVATYREVNPALYTIISFPFLFAVMFGDMGHGMIVLSLGLWMCLWEKRLSKKKGGEIWNIFFGGRYIILLMGLFSMYTGFVYNDVFSKSVNVFNSSWIVEYNTSTVQSNPFLQLDPKDRVVGIYPIGVDPIWQLAKNKIIFLNTFKMKLSIIFGVVHMIFGVCMSVVNFKHFKKQASIYLEFLPQVLFLSLLFGYMVFMMFFKWVKYSAMSDIITDKPGCAPSVLIMFINMMLFKSTKPLKGCNEFMFEGQKAIQMIFITIAFLCIPWLLLGKPLYVMFKRKQRSFINNEASNIDYILSDNEHSEVIDVPYDDDTAILVDTPLEHTDDVANNESDDDEPLSEVFIHQAIHTVEYILSTISHTASYLRLWALSLAHAQLSEVLWKMVLKMSFMFDSNVGSVAVFLIFAVWAMFTVAILVLMEGLSAFLHTLRLHWVEFMSKFYSGQGHTFEPFALKKILLMDE